MLAPEQVTGVAGRVTSVEVVGATLTALFVCLLLMWTLKRTAGLPLYLSVLVVPVAVGAGFGLAVGAYVFLEVPMLVVGGALAVAVLPLSYLYERRFGAV